MKKFKNTILIALVAVASVLGFAACTDWNDTESLDINTPSFEEQNPGLYADYLENLKEYKARPHKITIATFENIPGLLTKRAEHLSILPDSIDYISLHNPDAVGSVLAEEMEEMRTRKGTKFIYDVNYTVIDAEWVVIAKADEEGLLTEEDAKEYIVKRTNEMLEICDKHGYEGITFTYPGRSHVSLTEEEAVIYSGRQKTFFDEMTSWRNSHKDKFFAYRGNAEYLFDENKDLLLDCDYIILVTDMLKNGGDLTLKVRMTLDPGGIPSDRFIASVQTVRPNDANNIYGWFGKIEPDGKQLRSIIGAAEWSVEPSDFTRAGLYIINAQYDYYDNDPIFYTIRKGIEIMNPSPNN